MRRWLLDGAGRRGEARALLESACDQHPADLVDDCRSQLREFDPLSLD